MVTSSMQVCMDTTDWLKGIVHDEVGGALVDSSSPSLSGEMINCSRSPAVMERRLRPQHDQALKCPRCESTHTKFCYYNNYSLSQPRYFCKTCRRYWTKGGSLRNVPVGGGCRKNKRSGSKKSGEQQPPVAAVAPGIPAFHDGTDLHLSSSFPTMLQLSHLGSLTGTPPNLSFMECNKYDCGGGGSMFELGNPRNHLFIGGGDMGGLGDMSHGFASASSTFHGMSSLGFSTADGSHGGAFAETCQRLQALPAAFEGHGGKEDHHHDDAVEMKPSAGGGGKLLSLEWQEQGCTVDGYSNGLGLWAGLMNGH